MGLEIVEYVMEVEDTFGIRIEDEDYHGLKTPRLLAEYLSEKLHREGRCTLESSPLSEQDLIRRQRKSPTDWTKTPEFQAWKKVINSAPVDLHRPRPTTLIAKVLPQNTEFQFWKEWGEKLGVELPGHAFYRFKRYLTVAGICVSPFLLTYLSLENGPSGFWGGVVLLTALGLSINLLAPYFDQTDFYPDLKVRTLGDLARFIIPSAEMTELHSRTQWHWATRKVAPLNVWQPAEIEAKLMEMLTEFMCVKPGTYEPTDEFLEVFA